MPAKNKKKCIQKYLASIIAILVVNKILSNKSNYETTFYREHFRESKSDAKCYNELRTKNTSDNLSVADKINGSISLFHMKLTDQIDERIKYLEENPDATVEEYESKFEDYIPVKSLYINEQSAVFEYLYHNESRIIKRTVAKHRYYNEIDIVRNIKHHNIVTTYEAFVTNNGETSWVIMEKMDFALNFDYVNKDITKIKKIAKSVALALKYLHGKNILHNDIKLENIMVKVVGNEHVIKLIDFGCSQILEDGNTWVKADFWAATLPYVAPETYEYGHYSKQTDIWLLGMTLLFLAEDKILFTDNEGEFISKAYKNFVRKTTTYLKGDRRIYGTLKKVLKANKAQRMSLDEIIEWSEKKE